MIGRIAFAVVTSVALAGPAVSASANGAGFGMMSCAEAMPLFDHPDYRRGFTSWTLGFMSGVNGATIRRERHYRDLEGLSTDLVIGSLRATCAAEPDDIVLRGAERMWLTLPTREWKSQP